MSRQTIDSIISALGEAKYKGDEILPKYCPFCKGGNGRGRDQYTFAMNTETGAYNCLRGSCGVSGSIKQLAEHIGVDYKMEKDNYFREPKRKQVVYKKPEYIHHDLTKEIVEYFKLRGISQETLIKNKVSSKDANIQFNFFRNDELIFVKYKLARKPGVVNGKKESKSWREGGTEAILYGMDDCDPKYPLIIIEGEPDKLILDECGIRNATSIPSGTNDMSWIENCWEFLERFDEIILWGDGDKAGREFVQDAIVRLDDWKLKIVQTEGKDANEIHFKCEQLKKGEGIKEIRRLIESAQTVTKQYITDLSDVKRIDYKNMKAIPTGYQELDSLLGGMYQGQLVIWTGYNGSGKSTILSNIILNGVKDNKTFAYSGELSKEDFKEWMDLQLSGRKYLTSYFCDVKKQDIPIPDPKYFHLLDNFYHNQMFLFDSDDYATDIEVLKAMEYMAKREGCKVFLIDNLMTTPLSGNGDTIEKTAKYIIKLKKFARKYKAIVHLVAHPRKPMGGQVRVDKYSISGTANISDLADRVIGIHALTKVEKEKMEYEGYSSIVIVFKDRKFGVYDKELLFKFEYFSKRFYQTNEEKDRKYEWVEKINKGFEVLDEDEDIESIFKI